MNEADAGDRFGGKIPTSTCLGELIFNSAVLIYITQQQPAPVLIIWWDVK